MCNNLNGHGWVNSNFDIPILDKTLNRATLNTSMELDPDGATFFNDNKKLLNKGQIELFDTISKELDRDKDGMFNLDDPGGYGETFVADIILAGIRKDGKVVIAMALSAIAATLLKLGLTLHQKYQYHVMMTPAQTTR